MTPRSLATTNFSEVAARPYFRYLPDSVGNVLVLLLVDPCLKLPAI